MSQICWVTLNTKRGSFCFETWWTEQVQNYQAGVPCAVPTAPSPLVQPLHCKTPTKLLISKFNECCRSWWQPAQMILQQW